MAADPKEDLHGYLRTVREALLWKLDGLSEYDVRRPMTPTGTNLLGLVKHVASVEVGYFGEVFGRPFPEPLPWFEDGAEANADMWATADESREQIVGLYRRAWAHSDVTIERSSSTTSARVPYWPPSTERGDAAPDPGAHDRRDASARRPRRHRPRAHRRRRRAPGRQRQHGAGRRGVVGGVPCSPRAGRPRRGHALGLKRSCIWIGRQGDRSRMPTFAWPAPSDHEAGAAVDDEDVRRST